MPAQYNVNAYTPGGTSRYIATSRYFFTPLFKIAFRFEVSGRENIPNDSPLVFVANHLSNADPPFLTAVVDRPVAYLAKEELFTVPGLKEWMLAYGAISVDRDKPEISTFKAVKNVFEKGWNLGMFIEGTRNRQPERKTLGKPHTGPAYFARANKALLVPVGITGTNKPWQKAYGRIGKPIEPSKDLDATTWEIMDALSDLTGFALPEKTKPSDSV